MVLSAAADRSGQRLGQIVLDELKERLLDGRYEAGSRISIEEVRADLGVSKQPVMDAMRRLEAIGIVEIVPQSGCRVARHSLREVQDFFRIFGRFEGELAAAAAQRHTPEQLAELDGVALRLEDLPPHPDPAERSRGYRRLNRDFHLLIHRMAHSQVMSRLSENMWDLSDFLISTVGSRGGASSVLDERNHDHDMIREAIRTGNADVARVAMESHIVRSIDAFGMAADD